MTIKRCIDNLTFPFSKTNLVGGYAIIEWNIDKVGDYENMMDYINDTISKLSLQYANLDFDYKVSYSSMGHSNRYTSLRWDRLPTSKELVKLIKQIANNK